MVTRPEHQSNARVSLLYKLTKGLVCVSSLHWGRVVSVYHMDRPRLNSYSHATAAITVSYAVLP